MRPCDERGILDLPAGPLAHIVSGYRAAGHWPRTPALPAAAFVRLKAPLLAGSLIRYDGAYAHAAAEELSSASVADGG